MIIANFSRSRMELAIELKNKRLCKQAYEELKQTNLQTKEDQIRKYMFASPIRGMFLRIFRKLKKQLKL